MPHCTYPNYLIGDLPAKVMASISANHELQQAIQPRTYVQVFSVILTQLHMTPEAHFQSIHLQVTAVGVLMLEAGWRVVGTIFPRTWVSFWVG